MCSEMVWEVIKKFKLPKGRNNISSTPTPITKQTDVENFVEISKTQLPSSSCKELVPSKLPLLDIEMPSTSENTLCSTTVKSERRSLSPIDGTPSAYDTPVKKRQCTSIIELENFVKIKNKKLRKICDCNRRLIRKIVSLKSLLAEWKKNIDFSRKQACAKFGRVICGCAKRIKVKITLIILTATGIGSNTAQNKHRLLQTENVPL